jgi:hypothetical protein
MSIILFRDKGDMGPINTLQAKLVIEKNLHTANRNMNSGGTSKIGKGGQSGRTNTRIGKMCLYIQCKYSYNHNVCCDNI